MSWQTSPRDPAFGPKGSGSPATAADGDPTATNPVILRTSTGRVYLGRLRVHPDLPDHDPRANGYGQQAVILRARPVYTWPKAGIHELAATASEGNLAGVRLGPAVAELWVPDARVCWALDEDGYQHLNDLPAVAGREDDEPTTGPEIRTVVHLTAPEGADVAAGIARVAAAMKPAAAL